MHLCYFVKILACIYLKINMDTSQEFWLDKMIDREKN